VRIKPCPGTSNGHSFRRNSGPFAIWVFTKSFTNLLKPFAIWGFTKSFANLFRSFANLIRSFSRSFADLVGERNG
jgi:hypothetical protein